MIDFYNAFISYKHAPLDSKVAEHVQRSLEHFHIPHAIRKKTGKKKIERVFRDKDELPITSDLTDTISNALEKADYLIVICSPRTKESIWVEREINFFLKNHHKDRVLTVLAEGEPQEVIPDILTHDEREMIDFNGMTTTVKVPIEPLSCDYRMPLGKAKKLELPRLASALIGCSYDELVRRQRAYRMRRVMALSAVLVLAAVGFGTYMTVKQRQIAAALQQAMINRSKYLATESNNLYHEQRRRDALYLALAALPSEENPDIPVTGEAVSALSQASYAYRGEHGASIMPLWDYSTGSNINGFWVCNDGSKLIAVDELQTVTVWNTEDHSVIYTMECQDVEPFDCVFVDDDIMILMGEDNLIGCDLNDGSRIWTLNRYEDEADDSTFEFMQLMSNGKILVITNDDYIRIIDPSDGEAERQFCMPDSLSVNIYDIENATFYTGFAVSPDSSKLAFRAFTQDMNHTVIGVYDLQTDEISYSDQFDDYAYDLTWLDNDYIVTATYPLGSYDTSRILDSYVLSPNERTVYCFNARNLNQLWQNTMVCTSMSFRQGFMYMEARGLVGCYGGNRFSCYDVQTGELMYDWCTNESIIDVTDRDGDGWPLIITREGAMVQPALNVNNESIRLSYEFVDQIENLVVNHGVYIRQENSDRIIYYNAGVYDEEWEQTDDVCLSYIADSYLDDNVLVTLSGSLDESMFTIIDPNENELVESFHIDDEGALATEMNILGADEDNIYVSCCTYSDGLVLYTIDISNGRYTSDILADVSGSSEFCASYSDGYLCYMAGSYSSPSIGIRPADGGHEDLFSVPLDNTYSVTAAPRYYQDIERIYVAGEDGDYIINTDSASHTRVVLPDNWNRTTMFDYDPVLNRFVVSDGDDVVFVDIDSAEVVSELGNTGMVVTGFDFFDFDGVYTMLVIYDGGHLYRYDAATGEFIANSDISAYVNYLTSASFEYDEQTGLLYVQQAELTSVVETETWVELSFIEYSFGHHAPTDRFYTRMYEVSSESSVGCFRHYSLEDLIARANEILGGNPTPEDLINLYGL